MSMKVIYYVLLISSVFNFGCSNKNMYSSIDVSNIKLIKGKKPPKHSKVINQQSLMIGKLIVKDGCTYLYNTVVPTYTLVQWPWDTEAQLINKKIIISRASKPKDIVEVGSNVSFGGGWSSIKSNAKKTCPLSSNQVFWAQKFKLNFVPKKF